MIDSLEHLPKQKQRELTKVSEIITGMCGDTEMVILFGSYARGDYKLSRDLKPYRRSGHVSDYDILVVTGERDSAKDQNIWDRIETALKKVGLSAQARVIAHDVEEVNIKLAQGHYFFSDIKREGCLLYDSGRCILSDKRDLNSKEWQRIAQDHFDYWFKRAKVFFIQYNNALEIPDNNNAAFNLHQTVEVCYKTILLVFTNYSPNEHWLEILKDRAGSVSGDETLVKFFLKQGCEDNRRFKLLDYAYIGARYDPDYRISKEDLIVLAESVKNLMDQTESLCINKISGMSLTDRPD